VENDYLTGDKHDKKSTAREGRQCQSSQAEVRQGGWKAEERVIWPRTTHGKNGNVLCVEGMSCVVEERVIVMKLEIKRVSDRRFLVDVHVTMLTFGRIERYVLVRRTVLLHSV